MNILLVGGFFNDKGGKHSSYIKKMAVTLFQLRLAGKRKDLKNVTYQNGGYFEDLEKLLNKEYDIIFWMPNIPNDKPKLIKIIKQRYPKTILVTSKRNLEGKYSFMLLIARALAVRSNLLIEFTGDPGNYQATIMDPLANIYGEEKITDPKKLMTALMERINELLKVQRMGCSKTGMKIECPDQPEFFKIIRQHARKFHDIIHAAETTRFLGNASFRCEFGFPSFLAGEYLFVSKRNVDKREINADNFVAIDKQRSLSKILYYGDNKPSVDTPVHVKLYHFYEKIHYIIHGHVYIDGAPSTGKVLPCGALQEFEEIQKLHPDPSVSNFSVNLSGHGSVILAENLEYLRNPKYIPRVIPEHYHKEHTHDRPTSDAENSTV